MKDHEGDFLGFTHLSQSWYGKSSLASADYIDEVMIGHYSPGGGTSGEFGIRWHSLGGGDIPRLEAFNDSWHTLYHCQNLLAYLADHDDEPMSPEELCEWLVENGFKDLTQRVRPK